MNDRTKPLQIAVVGGGLGGMSAAIHCAVRGHQVTLFERTGSLGGKAGVYESSGFQFDTGPSLLTMPDVLDELWSAAGAERRRDLDLLRLDPQCRYLFADGRTLDLRDDRAETLRAVGAHAPADEKPFEAVLALSRRMHEDLGRTFLEAPYEGVVGLARAFSGSPLRALRLSLFGGTLRALAERSVKDDGLRALIQRYATYAGGDPRRTPAVYGTIIHIESAGGCWYPRGGIHGLVRAIEGLLRRLDVRVELHAPVQRLHWIGPVPHVTANGVSQPFDAVVANADPVTVARRLLYPEDASRSGLLRYTKREFALSGAVLLLGIEGEPSGLTHHNVLFPNDYAAEFADIFQRRRAPRDPTVYVCIPSLHDPERAPAGCHTVFCMTNAPALPEGAREDEERTATIACIKAALSRVLPHLERRIRVEHFIGPADLRERYDAPGGSIYGLAPHGRLAPLRRPAQRVGRLPGLYFAGGGTHPGGGIPLVLRSGRFVADLIERDCGKLRRPLAIAA